MPLFLTEVLVTLISVTEQEITMDPRPIILNDLDTRSSEFKALLEELSEIVEGFGLSIPVNKLQTCLEHLLYVMQVNEYINLTRITDVHEALVLHILDSLTLLPYLPVGEASVLDMGSGAGFPGIPLATCTDLDVTLLDSVGKKIKADDAIAHKLGLNNVHGEHDRLESYALSHAGEFDFVVARALAPLTMLIEFATPYLKIGGKLVVSKGNPTDDEVSSGEKASNICGLRKASLDSFELPSGFGHREIFVFEKITRPTIQLPRAIGEARRKPLA